VFVCAAVAATVAWSSSARAFELKHTSHGDLVRWASSQITFIVDPSLASVVGGGQGVADAIAAWSGAAGAPALTSVTGTTTTPKPALDGQNRVLFAAPGFAPAGAALAVTVLSYDNITGDVIEADIVVNGAYRFAQLAAGTQASMGARPVSTEGGGDDEARHDASAFDIDHVVAHEIGHALGLSDERSDHVAMMYAYSMPGDATLRAPSNDDLDGLTSLYGGSASRAGCGHASVAGARTRASDLWAALALAVGAGAWRMSRRRARALVPVCAAFAAFVACPNQARSAASLEVVAADASARVVAVSTQNVRGIFETTLELEPSSCGSVACPVRTRARVWGGTIGVITQQVGERPAPLPGENVRVALARSSLVADGADGVEVTLVGDSSP